MVNFFSTSLQIVSKLYWIGFVKNVHFFLVVTNAYLKGKEGIGLQLQTFHFLSEGAI
jgi:hypothetical protein